MYISPETRNLMGLERDPEPLIVFFKLLADANLPKPDVTPPPPVLEWIGGMADRLSWWAEQETPVEVDPRDPEADPLGKLHRWMAPVVLSVIAPKSSIPTGAAGDLLNLCRREVRNQFPLFAVRIVKSWKTGRLPHPPF